jgi:hypothetical protein
MSKPSQGHINWVPDNDPSKSVNPGAPKGALGWTINEKPAFEFMNFLFATCDQWDKYFETTTDTLTTQQAATQAQVSTQGTASGVTASNTGHVKLTGTTVQVQLDQADASFKDLYDALTTGKGIDLVGYDAASPANWSPNPTNAGAGLDQLAARVHTVEAATAGNSFVAASFNDYVIAADKPVTGFPSGIGNPGLTSTLANNPRSIKISELQTQWGEERLYIHAIKQTGKYDANGLEEWAVVAPKHENRIMLYGNWENTSAFEDFEGSSYNQGQCIVTSDPASYALVTGICDGVALITNIKNLRSDQILVDVDTVSTGSPISIRGSSILQNRHGQVDQIVGDSGLTNIGYNIHTFKFQNGATDANAIFTLLGFILITTGTKELGGGMYLNKVLTQYTPGAVTDPVVGGKGGKVIRYVDPADSLRKDAVSNVLEVNSNISGSLGSGSTSAGINSATGWVAGSIAEISDGPTNAELIYVSGVNTFTNTLTFTSPGTLNSYTNPTVKLYAKTEAATDHSNEKEKFNMHVQAFSSGQRDIQASDSPEWLSNDLVFGVFQGMTQDGVYCLSSTDARVAGPANGANNGRYNEALNISDAAATLHIDFRGTGLDMLFDSGYQVFNGSFDIKIDGVQIPSINFITPFKHPKWIKLCSDLPEGSHRITFYATGPVYALGFVMAKIYEASEPTSLATIERGDILSKRTKIANYLYNTDPRLPSKGVIKQHIWQNTIFANINPSVTTFGWASVTYDVIHGYGGAPDYVESDSTVTGDVIRKWFYCGANGGIEVNTVLATSHGISEYRFDGNLATAANFPGMTFQGGGANFNSATGLFDAYIPGATTYIKLSFYGLSEGWHQLQIKVTGTKNVASTTNTAFCSGFYIINGAFTDEVFNNSTQLTCNVTLGGAKDLRLMDAYNTDNRETPVEITTTGGTIGYGSTPGYYWGVLGSIGCVETSGGDLEIALKVNAYITPAGYAIQAIIMVDGILYDASLDSISASGYPIEAVARAKVPVLPGRHFIRGVVSATGGSLATEYTGISIREIPKRRAK